jgi:hypothetical protein
MASCLSTLCAILILVAALGPAVSFGAQLPANGCLDRRQAQALVTSHQIKTWPAIKSIAGISDQYKEVSAVRVCERGGQPYYVVNVAAPYGESKQLVLNAVDGSD